MSEKNQRSPRAVLAGLGALVAIVVAVVVYKNKVDAEMERDKKVSECHSRVESRAKHDPDFLSANVRATYISGEVRLQNGFGAWTKYDYSCDTSVSNTRSKAYVRLMER